MIFFLWEVVFEVCVLYVELLVGFVVCEVVILFKYFYDFLGSKFFEVICVLFEYYFICIEVVIFVVY